MITSKFPSLPKVPDNLPDEQTTIEYLTALRRRMIDELTIIRKTLERADLTSQTVAEEYEPDEIVQYSLPKKRIISTGYTVDDFAPADHSILSATHGDTTAAAVVRGDMIAGIGATPKWERVVLGAQNTIWAAGATEPGWATRASLFGSGTDNYIPKFGTGATPTFGDSVMSQVGTDQISIATSTTNSPLRIGSCEIQSYATNNWWLADNLYFNGSVFKYRSAGAGWIFQFTSGSFSTSWAPTSTAGATASPLLMFNVPGASTGGGIGTGGGGDANAGKVVTFGYSAYASTFKFPHFIANRHAGGTAAGNSIEFSTCDGTEAGTYPANAIHGLTVSNGTIGIGTGRSVLPSYKIHALLSSAATNVVTDILALDHNSTGTPAAGFGGGILGRLESTTTNAQDAAQIAWSWTDATHATRTSKIAFSNVYNAGTLTERFSLTGTEAVFNDGSEDYDFRVEGDII